MSKPKRFTISGLHPHLIQRDDGEMIYYEDYANLQAFSDEAQAHIAKEERKSRERLDMAQADYANLKSEFNRLKNTDPNSISGSTIMSDPDWSIACFRFHRENERAEIARLRKAGDNLERVLTTKVASYEVANASHEWRTAKEDADA